MCLHHLVKLSTTMKFTIIVLLLSFSFSVYGDLYDISTAEELINVLQIVNPGDTIQLNDGLYNGTFVANRNGTSDAPITLRGTKNVVLTGPLEGYGFYLRASYWHLQTFNVTGTLRGVIVERGQFNVLEDLDVGFIQEEGIHFWIFSSDNVLRNSRVHDTGLRTPGFGEGVYLGQAFHNWANGQQDQSLRNHIYNNHIGPNIAAESIDIKEGSCCGIIEGNTFDGTGMTGENGGDSWIDIKGDSYLIRNNTGKYSKLDGFQINHITEAGMGGCNNRIEDNICQDLPDGGQCVSSAAKGCTNYIENNVTT